MKSLIGFATLTFIDGSIFQGQVKLKSLEPAGNGYIGRFQTEEFSEIAKKLGKPILSVGDLQYRVSVTSSGTTDCFTVETFGSPFRKLSSIHI